MRNVDWEIYPYHVLITAPTFGEWVRLPISHIHQLERYAEPHGSKHKIFFYLNHPIRFVCICGPVVAFGDVYTKHTLFYLDDGSGQTIAIKVLKLPPEDVTPQAPSNTTVSNVNITSGRGGSDIRVDDIVLDIGTVVKLKCTIEEFREVKQLALHRAWILKSTTDEAQEWELQAESIRRLSTPWVVSKAELESLDEKLRKDQVKQQAAARKRVEYLRKRESRHATKRTDDEKKRKALENAMNDGALI